ncbi:MAG: hypothetical protein DLM62_05890 [Pseudonocardiales bacterium]|nr:MAG: hypothetical protein DLM62_05890 [Pseudonocardiales bacterium]
MQAGAASQRISDALLGSLMSRQLVPGGHGHVGRGQSVALTHRWPGGESWRVRQEVSKRRARQRRY